MRYTGRSRSCWDTARWSMHARSSQMRGSRPRALTKALRQSWRASHLCKGSSDHEWLRKASHSPNAQGSVRAGRSATGQERSRSSAVSLSRLTQRMDREASAMISAGSASPSTADTPTAAETASERIARRICTWRLRRAEDTARACSWLATRNKRRPASSLPKCFSTAFTITRGRKVRPSAELIPTAARSVHRSRTAVGWPVAAGRARAPRLQERYTREKATSMTPAAAAWHAHESCTAQAPLTRAGVSLAAHAMAAREPRTMAPKPPVTRRTARSAVGERPRKSTNVATYVPLKHDHRSTGHSTGSKSPVTVPAT
mmetsp:Transcript_8837/g.30062  ORF Transcript_8837/g.30062 Transcript_8837/m.30062 type:complete len:316 (-) Transcript_8837:26-973(-)